MRVLILSFIFYPFVALSNANIDLSLNMYISKYELNGDPITSVEHPENSFPYRRVSVSLKEDSGVFRGKKIIEMNEDEIYFKASVDIYRIPSDGVSILEVLLEGNPDGHKEPKKTSLALMIDDFSSMRQHVLVLPIYSNGFKYDLWVDFNRPFKYPFLPKLWNKNGIRVPRPSMER